jgi:CAAX prenyl protease-like protein
MSRLLQRFPSLSYVLPFLVFIVFLGAGSVLKLNPAVEYPVRTVVVTLAVLFASREIRSWQTSRPFESVLVGVAVFVIWIAPDAVWPTYRHHWWFENSLTGAAKSSISIPLQSQAGFIAVRLFGTAVVVPIIEELFWRGWLMRYLVDSDFRSVPLGFYSSTSFWLTAVLFASEHGSFWEVGLAAGIAYNWWMLRSKSLFDCMLAHAVTNASLAVYVVLFQQWQYWL